MKITEILDAIKEMQQMKGKGYTQDVIPLLPYEAWETQIQIKVTRMKYASNVDKKVDELFDTIVYSLLLLERMSEDGVPLKPIMK